MERTYRMERKYLLVKDVAAREIYGYRPSTNLGEGTMANGSRPLAAVRHWTREEARDGRWPILFKEQRERIGLFSFDFELNLDRAASRQRARKLDINLIESGKFHLIADVQNGEIATANP